MLRKSDYFILLAVMISFAITIYIWFSLHDREQAIFTEIWVPTVLIFGIYFKLAAFVGGKR